MMTGWDVSALPLRQEAHFGDRVVTCRADRPPNCHAMFEDAVARAPEREALIDGDLRLTWRALGKLVRETASGLAKRGVSKGDRIVLLVGNRAEFVILLHAANRLGAILVPISVLEQAPGIAYVVKDCGARLLIHEGRLASRLPAAGDMPSGVEVVCLDEPAGDILHSLRHATDVPAASRHEEDVCLILYTSGTTGNPKGAMIAEINLVHAALIYEHVFEMGEGERTIIAVPMTHVTGISGCIAPITRSAGTVIIMSEFKAPDFIALAAHERMTQAVLVPAMYALCLSRVDISAFDLSAWRIGAYGGAPMPAATIESVHRLLPGLRLLNLYGSTETVVPQAIMPPEYAYERRFDVGLPCPGATIMVVDEFGCECPPNTPGELWLHNATVVPGYWNNAEATKNNIVAGFWRSGDLGQKDEHGFVRVLDRIKDMINRGGYKVYTAEVENALCRHPQILECAVIGKPCDVLGERVHAFVSITGDNTVTEDELKAFSARELAEYKQPESFDIWTTPLPRNANGKLLKREMRSIMLGSSGK